MEKGIYILAIVAIIILLFIFTLTALMLKLNLKDLSIHFKIANFEIKTRATYTKINKKVVNTD